MITWTWVKRLLVPVLLMAPAASAKSQNWAVEAGSGFAYVFPHPQIKLWYRLPNQIELGLGYSPGINNFDTWSQNLLLQGKYRWEVLPWLEPFATVDAGLSVFSQAQWQVRPFIGIGLGSDWMFTPTHDLGLTGSLHLLVPDPYSNSPFVFRPELSLRWLF